MPSERERRPFSLGWAVFWSLTWAVGVALGVALGGWLTVVSGSGAPGVESLSVGQDLFVIPAIAGAVVFVALLLARIIGARLRRSPS